MASAHRAILSVTLACNNQCVFCGQSGLPARRDLSRDELVAELQALRATADEVSFVGGEPSLHPELDALIATARGLGYRAIGVQTNGRSLESDRLESWVKSGLTDLHLSIHGHNAAAHDYHTGVEGSFIAAQRTIAAARAAGATVVVNTVLTRSNGRGLSELARLLARRDVAAWCISVPRVRGRAAESFDRVVPRLGVMTPFALHALTVATSLGLPGLLRGAPLCVLGPFARHSIAGPERAYGSACASCDARPNCPGIEPEYLERFDGDELSPSAAIAPSVDPRFARMFVGEGDLADPPSREVPEAPARARVGLPMLGKVQPARAEVPRTAQKKTGSALRELFKDLYQDGDETSE